MVIRNSQQTQSNADSKNFVLPVWVFVVMATNLERLWQLVRDRRNDGRLFHRVSSEASSNDQPAAPQVEQYTDQGPRVIRTPHFIQEAGTFTDGSDPRHTGSDRSGGLRNEAAILTVAPPPPILNPPRATSGNTQPPNPNVHPSHSAPDNFVYRTPAVCQGVTFRALITHWLHQLDQNIPAQCIFTV